MPFRKLLVRAIDAFRDTRKIDAAILWAELSEESTLAIAAPTQSNFEPQANINQS